MEKEINSEKKHFYRSLTIPFVLTSLTVLVFLLEKGMDWNFHSAGISPRDPKSILHISTHAFIHANWEHLLNNCISLFVLSATLYYFYAAIATKILFLFYIFCGLLLWLIGGEGCHIGASGIIYALAFFLFCSGVLRGHTPLVAISLFIVFWYGGLVWAIFPITPERISWEGHLSGAIAGTVFAFVFRKEEPQRTITTWDENEENEENENESEEGQLEYRENES